VKIGKAQKIFSLSHPALYPNCKAINDLLYVRHTLLELVSITLFRTILEGTKQAVFRSQRNWYDRNFHSATNRNPQSDPKLPVLRIYPIQRFFIYAERGLAKKRVTIWIYEDRLNIEYKQALLARYDCNVGRKQRQLTAVTNPQLYDTLFASPQLELFVLDDDQWLKVIQRPPFVPGKAKSGPFAKQLLLWSTELVLYLLLWRL